MLNFGSDVFKKKFHSYWDDSSKKEQIVKEHISYESFYAFLKYFYTDEVDFTPELALDVYAVADFYQVKGLMNECEKILKSGLTVQNAADVYEKAIFLGAKDLCEFCFEFCREHLVDVVDDFETDECKKKFVLEVFRRAANQEKN
ncbi:RCC1 and BTB domain-containing protein 1-like [Cloeon dipterum]|uniref:RCC1 and BTB domain-containing protein 1-like n=1 Tax=Cloeon dipterum TaxID=197152 RepID=UPI0032208C62